MATKTNRHQRRQQQRLQSQRNADRTASAQSQQNALASSPLHQSQADEIELLEQFDGFAFLRNRLREIARERGDWAGIPMPLEGERLVIEPRYPNAAGLMAIGASEEQEDDDGHTVVNSWYSIRERCDIYVVRTPEGKLRAARVPGFHSLTYALKTLGCADAWGLEQESNAIKTLGKMVRHRQLKQYLLTGMFMERSKRSGVMYLFRKLRPTVAINFKNGDSRVMCSLCMHPIGHYRESWAGAMTPTDDVIAHLSMMRGDEAMFWRRATQHPAWRPEAGL